jgi:ribulose-5-phosphate 4-epimerase/fuculose-1-phosphate aldolase
MDKLEIAKLELVIANRVLAREGVTDASGHVSVRHPLSPERYLISESRSPELVEISDIMECDLDSKPVVDEGRWLYSERFIHGRVYAARPDVNAVVHAHTEDVLPFTVTSVPLRPVIGSASSIGKHVPLWDIREKFGDRTDLLVKNNDHGRDLVERLGGNTVVLMRGHGYTATRGSLMAVVRLCVFLGRNARVQLAAMRMGDGRVNGLTDGEIEVKVKALAADVSGMWRGWEYFAHRAGCAEMFAKLPRG